MQWDYTAKELQLRDLKLMVILIIVLLTYVRLIFGLFSDAFNISNYVESEISRHQDYGGGSKHL
jgi:hypothetical protein